MPVTYRKSHLPLASNGKPLAEKCRDRRLPRYGWHCQGAVAADTAKLYIGDLVILLEKTPFYFAVYWPLFYVPAEILFPDGNDI